MPELDIPGHSASWGLGEPELVVPCPKRVAIDDMGVEHGVDKVALHPLRERTYEVVASLLTELAAVFPDEYIHLGGDEIDYAAWNPRRTGPGAINIQALPKLPMPPLPRHRAKSPSLLQPLSNR